MDKVGIRGGLGGCGLQNRAAEICRWLNLGERLGESLARGVLASDGLRAGSGPAAYGRCGKVPCEIGGDPLSSYIGTLP